MPPHTLIGKAIREGKYLNITYKNKDGHTRPFWISILDIMPNDEIMVNMFNVTKDEPLLCKPISISGIQTAEILFFTKYEVSEELLKKIDEDEAFEKYNTDRYDNQILNYYLECYNANKDPFLHRQHLIPEIDVSRLLQPPPYPLSDEQQKHILKHIYKDDYNKFYSYELVVSEFSIDLESKGKFIVAYRNLRFDPVAKTLHVGSKTLFNPNFYIKDVKYALSSYSDLSPEDFEELYLKDPFNTIQELSIKFKTGELPNTLPEVVVLGFSKIDISNIYDEIDSDYKTKKMELPLKALFHNISSLNKRNRPEPNIVLYDKNINIDQLRTVYNALKYSVTYVQGPPGTGKTQTIKNIVVNCLTNNKTLLITSNNNTPINGIYENLTLGTYKDKEIHFPIIRLGNEAVTIEALKKIKNLYDFETKDVAKEELLLNIKEKSKEKNKELLVKLKNYEDRIEIQQKLEFINNIIARGNNYLLDKEKKKLEDELGQIPETTDDNTKGIFDVIKENHLLLQFFYYESLKHIKRLKSKDYSELVEILDISNEREQVKEFNKWLAKDDNLEKFTKVFPIILTTNLSSRKLGYKFKFDLLTIDEAGQCDIATSLIPISKCRNMVLIGDTNQLQPIVVFEENKNKKLMEQFEIDEDYNYFKNSILSVYEKIDTSSTKILLSYHYRCGKKIIDYSNKRFYENKLNLDAVKNIGVLKLIDVNNSNLNNKNSQIEEALAIVDYLKTNKLTDVFILTPFRHQDEVLSLCLKQAKEKGEIDASINCGTIHKVQGQENNTIIISTAISTETKPRTFNWLKNNSQLLNVGVTRAKENLIVVTDRKAIDILSKKDDDLYALIRHVESNGQVEISQSKANKFTIGFSNNSKFEDHFYRTMQHYCTVKGLRFERNVKILQLFPEEISNEETKHKEFDGVIFEGNEAKIVFEINGQEHSRRKKTMTSDKIKMELLNRKNIELIIVPNQYVKHYEFINALIKALNVDAYQETLFGS